MEPLTSGREIPEGVVVAMAEAFGPDSAWAKALDDAREVDGPCIFWQEGNHLSVIAINKVIDDAY